MTTEQQILLDRHRAEGRLLLRDDLRTPGGALCAPLAIAMLDAVGNSMDRFYQLALTNLDINLFDSARDATEVRVVSTVTRETRTAVFTEARFEDWTSGRLLGTGTADWIIVAPTPPAFETPTLHYGPILVTLEASALEAAARNLGMPAVKVVSMGVRIMRAGRTGPFMSTAQVLTRTRAGVACRAETLDVGADRSVVAQAHIRVDAEV